MTLYSNANGKDYYEIIKNGIPTQQFVEVEEGSAPATVITAYAEGKVVG